MGSLLFQEFKIGNTIQNQKYANQIIRFAYKNPLNTVNQLQYRDCTSVIVPRTDRVTARGCGIARHADREQVYEQLAWGARHLFRAEIVLGRQS